jgi:predicted transcriptional regulator
MAKMGRPPLGDAKQSAIITLWVMPDLKRELEDTAQRLGTSQSEIVRDALVVFLRGDQVEQEELAA